MNKLIIALAISAFAVTAQPAHADFFPEPFQNQPHVSAPADPAPAQTPAPSSPTEQKLLLEVKSPSTEVAAPAPRDLGLDANWAAPVTGNYEPMR